MIRVLKRALKTPGIHRVVWKDTDENGFKVPNGIYFVRLEVGEILILQNTDSQIQKSKPVILPKENFK